MRELTLWTLPNNGYDTVPALREHLSDFHREHAGIRASVWVRTPRTLWERLLTAAKEGTSGPDLVQIPSHWTSTLARLGVLADLGELDPGLDLGRWPASMRAQCRLDGTPHVYSLPWWAEARVLYYRRDALKAAGCAPEDLAAWEGFTEVCRRAAKRALSSCGLQHPVANPNPRESVSLADVAPCVWSRGGDLFAADGTRSLFQRERAERGIADYFKLLASGAMPLKGESGLAPLDLFEGACALQFSGRRPPPVPRAGPRRASALRARGRIGAVPFPAGDGATILSAWNLGVLRNTPAPREAYALARWLSSGSPASAYARAIGAFPAAEGPAVMGDEDPDLRGVFEAAFARARMIPNLSVLGSLERVFDRSMERQVREVARRRWSPETLREELIHAASEVDYILSFHAA
ncbi:MAG: extracellular solute-binding protein [Elusimicrobia bacterium]|nr:extracellular solute-binding protein [Elusimicrobiota bacterium]